MKVAFITSMDPFGVGGGAISCYRFITTLKSLKEKGMLGDILVIYLRKTHFQEPAGNEMISSIAFKKTKLAKIKSLLRLRNSVLEAYEKEIINHLLAYNPDAVIVHFSNLGLLTKKIRKVFPDLKIIQNFDNFEYKIIQIRNFTDLYSKLVTYFAEKNALIYSDCFIFLREDEARDIMQFYGVEKPFIILPFTFGKSNNYFETVKNSQNSPNQKGITLIFTAWFDAYFNKEAALFLIRHYNEIKQAASKNEYSKVKLIIAGHNAKRLKKYAEDFLEEIIVIDSPTPNEMYELFKSSDLYVSPVFSGQGMKTKVLESLYYGIPIVASYTSLRGYENDLGKYYSKFIFPFEDKSVNSFIESLSNAFRMLKSNSREEIRNEIVDTYNLVYNSRRFEKLLVEILKGK